MRPSPTQTSTSYKAVLPIPYKVWHVLYILTYTWTEAEEPSLGRNAVLMHASDL